MRTKEEIRKKQLEYYHKNKNRIKEYRESNKEKNREYQKIYYQQNKEKVKEYKKGYFKNNPEAKLTDKTRKKVANEIEKGIRFMTSTMKYLGCNFNTYSEYLETQFDKNMSWENYGEYWEIDHIIPLSKGGSFHYTNTQPLTVEENRKKKNNLDVI